EIGTKFNSLVKKADELLTLKYIVRNVAHRNGKTATFMPKPIVGDNGSGMHVHQSLAKGGQNLFSGDGYGGLSQLALWYIGGIFKHARAINAFANATTNSYKRLVPGFEAPVMLAYSARNRSASCRIPYVSNPKARRIEMRFPDPMQSGYLTFTALMMAGLDGIRNKIDPGAPSDKDLYDLPPEEEKNIPTVCHSLDQALEALDKDREFLKAGGVMSDDYIDGDIALKMQEGPKFRVAPHPQEYQLYYGHCPTDSPPAQPARPGQSPGRAHLRPPARAANVSPSAANRGTGQGDEHPELPAQHLRHGVAVAGGIGAGGAGPARLGQARPGCAGGAGSDGPAGRAVRGPQRLCLPGARRPGHSRGRTRGRPRRRGRGLPGLVRQPGRADAEGNPGGVVRIPG